MRGNFNLPLSPYVAALYSSPLFDALYSPESPCFVPGGFWVAFSTWASSAPLASLDFTTVITVVNIHHYDYYSNE